MREKLCKILGVPNEELAAAAERVLKQIDDIPLTAVVAETVVGLLRFMTVEEMMEEFGVDRATAHSRRSSLGYSVLEGLVEKGMVEL